MAAVNSSAGAPKTTMSRAQRKRAKMRERKREQQNRKGGGGGARAAAGVGHRGGPSRRELLSARAGRPALPADEPQGAASGLSAGARSFVPSLSSTPPPEAPPVAFGWGVGGSAMKAV